MKGKSSLYEINTVSWLYELSVKHDRQVTLGNVPPEEWDRFRRTGFDHIWLMGVWKRSSAGIRIFRNEQEYESFRALFDRVLPGWDEKEDLTGSPYSVAAYEPDQLVGDWNGIDTARSELNGRGILLILDFVPNHTAPDHPWMFEHPEYYIQARESDYKQDRSAYLPIHKEGRTLYIAHGKDPYFPPWTDTAQLNHFNPEMRHALIGELKNIARHCDGVRCDMAMLVLNDIFARTWGWAKRHSLPNGSKSEFWQDLRAELPDLLMIAEAYWNTGATLLSLGFDYVYDKKLYDLLRHASSSEIISYLGADIPRQSKFVRFIENHDEPRSADVFGRGRLMASAVLFSTLPGMNLFHHGQFEGRKIRLPVQIRRAQDEGTDAELHSFYSRLLKITKLDAFSSGTWELKHVVPEFDESFRNLIAYTWTTEKDSVLIIVNFSEHFSQGRIPLGREIASPDADHVLVDELNEQVFKRKGREMMDPGLHVILEGYHSHILYMPKDFSF